MSASGAPILGRKNRSSSSSPSATKEEEYTKNGQKIAKKGALFSPNEETLDMDDSDNDGDNDKFSIGTSVMDGIFSTMMESIASMSLSMDDDDGKKLVATIANSGDNDDDGQHTRGGVVHAPELQSCVHEGSWANMYLFNDPSNVFGGKTGAVIVKTFCDQYPSADKMERLQKERTMSSWLSTTHGCSAVRAPLGHGVWSNHPRTICFEWVPGSVTLREWSQQQQNYLNLSDNSNGDHDNDQDQKMENHRSLLSSRINLAHKISTSLSEIHETCGAVVSNLSAEHIIVKYDTKSDRGTNHDDNDTNNDISVHIISLGSASLIHDGSNTAPPPPQQNNELHTTTSSSDGASTNHQVSKQGVQNDLRCLGDVLFELFSGHSPYHDDQQIALNDSSNEQQDEGHFNTTQHSNTASSADADEDADDIGGGVQSGGKSPCQQRRRPLRELRSILSISSIPHHLVLFILELMGAFRSMDFTKHYKSSSEVSKHLQSMISADPNDFFSFESVKQDSLFERLNLASKKLYGRKNEKSMLLNAYKRVIVNNGEREVVLVSGFSGAGKTLLVEQTLREPLACKGGHFLRIKFDMPHHQTSSGPVLSSIHTVFEVFCEHITASVNDERLQLLKVGLEDALGADGLIILADILPEFFFRRIIGDGNGTRERKTSSKIFRTESWMQQKNQFMYIFRLFVGAISGPSEPIILFFEDMQWADAASLDFVRSLILDSKEKSMLVVESYRENEVDHVANHPFSSHLRALKIRGTALTEIRVDSLKKDDIHKIITTTIGVSDLSMTEPLASVIYRKTSGNALLVIQFIKSLWEDGLLWFSFRQMCWQWDINLLESKSIPRDAASLLAKKILFLPMNTQLALKKIACIGSQCCITILQLICSKDDASENSSSSSLFCELDIAIKEGLVNLVGHKYKFAHDQIQSASYSLIPEQHRGPWHLRIGKKILAACNSEDEIEERIFLIVDALNRGKLDIKEETECISLAELNYRAAKKAMSAGVFSSASFYLREGMSLLEEKHKESHYSIWIKLCTTYMESEYCNGNFESVGNTVTSILTHAKCIDDKLPAYKTLLLTIAAETGRAQESIELGLDALRQVGVKFPTNPDESAVMAEFFITKGMLEGKDVNTIMLKVMDDKLMLTIVDLLETMVAHCKLHIRSLIIFRIIQLSLSHGVCVNTINALAHYGVILCHLGDIRGGQKYGEFALDIMSRMEALEKYCLVYSTLYSRILVKTVPAHLCLDPLLKAHCEGLKAGDTTYAMLCAVLYCAIYFRCNEKLSEVQCALAGFEKEAKLYRQEAMWNLISPVKQAILNLMGQAGNPAVLNGGALDLDTALSRARKSKAVLYLSALHYFQMMVAYMFGDIELAINVSEMYHDLDFDKAGRFSYSEAIYLIGHIYLVQARKTKEYKWTDRAKESIAEMQKFAEEGPKNYKHKLILLEAEYAFSMGLCDKASEKYELAIFLSEQNGYISEQASFYELAANFYAEQCNESKASQYYGKAHALYLKWGAQRKADHLREHFPF